MNRNTLVSTAGLSLLIGAGLATPAGAQDFGSQQSYRLSDPNERIVKLNILDLRERRRGGAFEYNTNIERQVNCNLTVSATGNAATPTHAGTGISPVGFNDSGIDSQTVGNTGSGSNSSEGSQSTVSGGFTSNGASGNLVAVSNTNLNGNPNNPNVPVYIDTSYGTTSSGRNVNGSSVNAIDQSNSGSSLGSSVNSSPLTSQIGDISADGAQILNTLDTTQSNADSPVTASANDSSSCQFVENTTSSDGTSNAP